MVSLTRARRTRGAPRLRRRRVLRWVVGAIAFVLVAWLVAGYLVLVDPSVDHPTRADAVVVLGPPTAQDRIATASQLLDAGVANNLVISLFPKYQPVVQQRYCETPQRGLTVYCFKPDPGTTRGEAEWVRTLAAQQGWHTLVIVTSTYHVSRARMIFKRCFTGRLQMVGTSHGMSLGKWAYEYVYQTGAFVKAAFESGC